MDDSIYDKPGPAAGNVWNCVVNKGIKDVVSQGYSCVVLHHTGRRLQRSLSLRASKKGDRSTSLQRTASLRPGSDKSTPAIKDINLKTSNVHREKDKGITVSQFCNFKINS